VTNDLFAQLLNVKISEFFQTFVGTNRKLRFCNFVMQYNGAERFI